MVSKWDVYLVMQLDTFILCFGLASALCFLVFIFSCMWLYDTRKESDQEKQAKKWRNRNFLAGFLCLILAAFTPNSKTMAAMIILPAMTSEQVVEPLKGEAKELYGLAKQALTGLAGQYGNNEQETE